VDYRFKVYEFHIADKDMKEVSRTGHSFGTQQPVYKMVPLNFGCTLFLSERTLYLFENKNKTKL